MKEIEILVELYDDFYKVKKVLDQYDFVGIKKVIDEYYYDPMRDDLKPDKNNKLYNCLRLRQKNDDFTITYKNDVYDEDKWLFSNEFETKIESINIFKNILAKLGFKKYIEINNTKYTYIYKKYEIVLEEVKDLGIFMEVEYCTDEDVDVKEIKEEINEFINNLSINHSEELNMGKPEMYLKKHHISIE